MEVRSGGEPDSAARMLSSVEELKVFAHPLRNRVLGHLSNASEPMSVRELAAVLQVEAPRLHYHVSLLEEHGFVEVVDTQISGKRHERRYRARNDSYHIGESMLSGALKGIGSRLMSSLRSVARDFVEIADDPVQLDDPSMPRRFGAESQPVDFRVVESRKKGSGAVDADEGIESTFYVSARGVPELKRRFRKMWEQFVSEHQPKPGEARWRVDITFTAFRVGSFTTDVTDPVEAGMAGPLDTSDVGEELAPPPPDSRSRRPTAERLLSFEKEADR